MTDHFGNVITPKKSMHIVNDVTSRFDEPALLCNDLIERLRVSNVNLVLESSIAALRSAAKEYPKYGASFKQRSLFFITSVCILQRILNMDLMHDDLNVKSK